MYLLCEGHNRHSHYDTTVRLNILILGAALKQIWCNSRCKCHILMHSVASELHRKLHQELHSI